MANVSGLNDVLHNLDAMAKRTRRNLDIAADKIALDLQAEAMTHHPWKKRTGLLEGSIKGEVVERSPDVVRIRLSANTEYAAALEFARDGKWAWMQAALDNKVPDILAALKVVIAT